MSQAAWKNTRSMTTVASLSRPLRVMQLTHLVNRHDFIDVVVRHADPTRFEMSVCTLGVPSNIADPEYESAGIKNWSLNTPTRKQYPRAVVALEALLRREAIDVVHAHHYEPGAIAAAATLLHPRTALVIGRQYFDAIYRSTDGAKRRLMLAVESACNRRARRIIVPSRMIADLLCHRQGVPREKVVVIPYGFEEEKFEILSNNVQGVRTELGLDGRTTIGTFARLHRHKGHRYLLDAMAKIVSASPDVLLLLVGEGPERPELERQIADLDLNDHVRLLGWRRDGITVMSAVDIVVQPTLEEAFGQAMIEALWLGKPLVTTDVCGAADMMDNAVDALIVRPGDTRSLASSVISLMGDESLRRRLGETARKRVQKELTVDNIVPRFERLYGRVAAAPTQRTT